MLIPDLEVPTLTELHTLSVTASASGMLSIKERSRSVIPLWTSAEYPPRKSTPTVFAAWSSARARTTSSPGKFAVRKLAGVIEMRLLTIGTPYSRSRSSPTGTIFSARRQIRS